jgi:hypothetical protein
VSGRRLIGLVLGLASVTALMGIDISAGSTSCSAASRSSRQRCATRSGRWCSSASSAISIRGIVILGERPVAGTVAGLILILILAGSYLSTSGAAGPARAPRRDAPACGDYGTTAARRM